MLKTWFDFEYLDIELTRKLDMERLLSNHKLKLAYERGVEDAQREHQEKVRKALAALDEEGKWP